MSKALQKHSGDGQISAFLGLTPEERMDRLMETEAAILADVSGSMAMQDGGEGGREQRWTVMNRVLDATCTDMRGELVIVAFADEPVMVTEVVPQPDGMTDMGRAIRYLHRVRENLKRVVLISDGEPTVSTDELSPGESAVTAARNLGVRIDVVYIGSERNMKGHALLQRIATAGGGEYHEKPLTEPVLLAETVQRLLLT